MEERDRENNEATESQKEKLLLQRQINLLYLSGLITSKKKKEYVSIINCSDTGIKSMARLTYIINLLREALEGERINSIKFRLELVINIIETVEKSLSENNGQLSVELLQRCESILDKIKTKRELLKKEILLNINEIAKKHMEKLPINKEDLASIKAMLKQFTERV